MHPRTLNRRLSDEGSSFRQIFNQTRFEFSRQMIVGTRVAITEIGLASGYADASAFTRASSDDHRGDPLQLLRRHRP